MSGYFDALIRSGGMTIDGGRPTTPSLDSQAFEVAADPHAPTTEIPTASAPPASRDVVRGAESVRPVAPPPEGQERVVRQVRPTPDDVQARTHYPPEARAESPATPRVRSDERSAPDFSARLVRAAVRWIAADASTIGNVPAREHSVAPAHDDVRRIQAAAARDSDREASIVTPMIVEAKTTAREPAAHVLPPVETTRIADPYQVHATPPAHDEIVEISIGSIHVRVDAPPAQTIARPAMTRPVTNTPRADARPGRSALSRRALRRI
ncbi:MAG TPA: hypothetical protein VKE96_29560 [Vicinamibacterales bacterium]|nr:hypothetical protein [Vicinamibacterales bacterium]